MTRDEVLTTLRQHAPELQARGIIHLSLFGSTARNEATSSSDVDLMAEYDTSLQLSLLDIVCLANHLTDILGTKVDLATRNRIKPLIRSNIEADAIHAF